MRRLRLRLARRRRRRGLVRRWMGRGRRVRGMLVGEWVSGIARGAAGAARGRSAVFATRRRFGGAAKSVECGSGAAAAVFGAVSGEDGGVECAAAGYYVSLFRNRQDFFAAGGGPVEHWALGILLGGAANDADWSTRRETDFFDLKGVVESVLESLRVTGASFEAAAVEGYAAGDGGADGDRRRVGGRDRAGWA